MVDSVSGEQPGLLFRSVRLLPYRVYSEPSKRMIPPWLSSNLYRGKAKLAFKHFGDDLGGQAFAGSVPAFDGDEVHVKPPRSQIGHGSDTTAPSPSE